VIRPNPRPRRFSIATFILIAAAGPARADPPTPAPPPQPSGPVATPYPGSEPLPPCPHTFCLPGTVQEATTPPSPPVHKHLAGVKYSDLMTGSPEQATVMLEGDGSAKQFDAQFVSWGKLSDSTTVYSADPMEGGQIAARKAGRGAKAQLDGTTVYSADPMEGGQIAARQAGTSFVPGKAQIANVQLVTEPVAKGTAIFKLLAGACSNGKHLDKVIIRTRSRSFTLHDATVIGVTPADAVGGQPMEQVTVAYASVGD